VIRWGDGAGLGDEPSRSVAGGIDDVVVGVEDAVGQPGLAQVLPDVLDRVELRGALGQQDHGDVLRDFESWGGVPAGAVEEQHGIGAAFDGAGDLVEVKLHRVGVGEGHGQHRAGAAGRTDCAKQVGALVALVGGLTGPGSPFGLLPHKAVLLADAGLVLKPDLDGLSCRQIAEMGP